MAARKATTSPATDPDPSPEETAASGVDTTTDYTRAGGHVLTQYGWVPQVHHQAAEPDPDAEG